MYQGGLSKSEMEKTATRKFTSRTPRIDTKPAKLDEIFLNQSDKSNDTGNELASPVLEDETADINISENISDETIEDISANPVEENNEIPEDIVEENIVEKDNQESEESSLTPDNSEEDNNNNS